MMALAGLSVLAIVLKRANLTERTATRFAEDQSRFAMEAVQGYYTGVNHELLLKQPEMRELRGRLLQALASFTFDTSPISSAMATSTPRHEPSWPRPA